MNFFRRLFEKFWVWLGGQETVGRPVDRPTQADQPVVGPGRAEPMVTPAEPTWQSIEVTVEAGDTLYTIADQYNVPVQIIVQLNSLTSQQILIGQTLILPPTATPPPPGARRLKAILKPGSPSDPAPPPDEVRPIRRVEPDPTPRQQGQLDLDLDQVAADALSERSNHPEEKSTKPPKPEIPATTVTPAGPAKPEPHKPAAAPPVSQAPERPATKPQSRPVAKPASAKPSPLKLAPKPAPPPPSPARRPKPPALPAAQPPAGQPSQSGSAAADSATAKPVPKAAPKTAVPKPAIPQTPAPKAESPAPKAAVPKVADPKTPPPKTSAPKPPPPKAAVPKTATPKTPASKTAVPKTPEPKTVELTKPTEPPPPPPVKEPGAKTAPPIIKSPAKPSIPAEPAPTETSPKPAPPQPRHFPAQAQQGIYVAYHTLGNHNEREQTLRFVQNSCLNSVVLDIKNERGYLSYRSQVPIAGQIGANRAIIENLSQVVSWYKQQHIWTIARLVVFKDTLLAQAWPELAAKHPHTGQSWHDQYQYSWVDPFCWPVWDYNLQLAAELADLGFDEILFEALQFPWPDAHGMPQFSQPLNAESRLEAICGFLSAAQGQLALGQVKLGLNLVGYACWRTDDALAGHKLERLAPYLDVVCPVLFPSAFENGLPGHPNAANNPRQIVNNPGQIVYEGSKQAVNRLRAQGIPCQVRPWIQDFTPHKDEPMLDKNDIQAQISGAVAGGAAGFLAWNPQTVYTQAAYE